MKAIQLFFKLIQSEFRAYVLIEISVIGREDPEHLVNDYWHYIISYIVGKISIIGREDPEHLVKDYWHYIISYIVGKISVIGREDPEHLVSVHVCVNVRGSM
jgi:hypothetical protein